MNMIVVHKYRSYEICAQQAHTCTENVFKTSFQDVQNVNAEDVHHKT